VDEKDQRLAGNVTTTCRHSHRAEHTGLCSPTSTAYVIQQPEQPDRHTLLARRG
jgi:hypothetical protein